MSCLSGCLLAECLSPVIKREIGQDIVCLGIFSPQLERIRVLWNTLFMFSVKETTFYGWLEISSEKLVNYTLDWLQELGLLLTTEEDTRSSVTWPALMKFMKESQWGVNGRKSVKGVKERIMDMRDKNEQKRGKDTRHTQERSIKRLRGTNRWVIERKKKVLLL